MRRSALTLGILAASVVALGLTTLGVQAAPPAESARDARLVVFETFGRKT